jgi:hypothetical protein
MTAKKISAALPGGIGFESTAKLLSGAAGRHNPKNQKTDAIIAKTGIQENARNGWFLRIMRIEWSFWVPARG